MRKWWVVAILVSIVLQNLILILVNASIHSDLAITAHRILATIFAGTTEGLLAGILIHLACILSRKARP